MPLHGAVHLSSTSSWQVVPPGGAGLALTCRQVSRSPTRCPPALPVQSFTVCTALPALLPAFPVAAPWGQTV